MKTEVDSAEIDELLKLLAEAPRRIAAATKGLAEDRLYMRTEE